MTPNITDSVVKATIAAIASESATTEEQIQMLIEIALGWQKKHPTVKDLRNVISLYYRIYEMCGEDYPLLKAQAKVGMAKALQRIPNVSPQLLLQAKAAYEEALPILQQFTVKAEVAEVQMNLGLVLQSLVPFNLARIVDSISAYHQALQVFTWQDYPQEYAILYNNLAIAYLSMPLASEREYLHQGLAVQSLLVALKHIKLSEHPREYAMLQNNLGNAWQYLVTAHPLENNLRAIAAYDEALKVRNRQDTPIEYAHTISNKAYALRHLPDNFQQPEAHNSHNLSQSRTYYQEAWEIFSQYQHLKQAQLIAQLLQKTVTEATNSHQR
ncbi:MULTISPECIES: hypothetical protein [unclassified Tolypothrix]|uniref:hypothetical protein n=1 Tax=unclassified Tolypothrix TaxID=2649714 RepID=UPI0005EAC3E6|nr:MULTISPECIES: hypothetical protein [unclassified Tolypothrix]BAY94716.1 hypothetical protein NIES3275_67680 [Microchaete diplosiphon NIES-3275]EKE99050.1 transporter family protein, major facilitator family [Tolypothrix sp. PCC 7601]MBE9081373.1 hypothetical protein [Tolypothrix sp. LEGE 11397]UYD28408.1 hypothetical protein HGR01_10400 [Tolypothrix sp. PCC 7712]UYD35714.1 hypothetical protein HG267_08165 [Tolypothrix sp. PCC 7601]